jgi:hypothetical protein
MVSFYWKIAPCSSYAPMKIGIAWRRERSMSLAWRMYLRPTVGNGAQLRFRPPHVGKSRRLRAIAETRGDDSTTVSVDMDGL